MAFFKYKEPVQAIDVSAANKICNEKLYLDNKK